MKNILNAHYLRLAAGWIAALAVGWAVLWLLNKYTPPQHNPFAPLDLRDPIGMATYRKFTNLKHDREACFAALDETGVEYTPIPDRVTGEHCGFENALTLGQSMTPYSATLSMTCIQTAALYTWEVKVARPAAVELLGSEIARMETYGAYSCRTISGSRRWSQHSRANAVDISGFQLKDGRLIDVRTHWGNGGPEGQFLKRVRDGACRVFSVTLGPEYNAAHADHFHLDMGRGDVCR